MKECVSNVCGGREAYGTVREGSGGQRFKQTGERVGHLPRSKHSQLHAPEVQNQPEEKDRHRTWQKVGPCLFGMSKGSHTGTANGRAVPGTFTMMSYNENLGSSKKREATVGCWAAGWGRPAGLGGRISSGLVKWLGASRGEQSLSEKFTLMKLLPL